MLRVEAAICYLVRMGISASGDTRSSAGTWRRIFLTLGLLFAFGGWMAASAQANAGGAAPDSVRVATEFHGASIVERIQAAILDCGPNPCEVYIPTRNLQCQRCFKLE